MKLSSLLLLVLLLGLPASANPPPIEAFFQYPAYSSVELSPDGENIVALARINGHQNIVVLNLASGKAYPITQFSHPDKRIGSVFWANSNRILFYVWLLGDPDRVTGDWYIIGAERKLGAVNKDGSDFRELFHSSAGPRFSDTLFHLLPDDPDHVLVIHNDVVQRANVNNGRLDHVGRSYPHVTTFVPDRDGRLRAGMGNLNDEVQTYYRNNDKMPWKKLASYDWWKQGGPRPLGFGYDGRTLYLASDHESDREQIYEFDVETGKWGEAVFGDSRFDVSGPLVFSHKQRKLLGIHYEAETSTIHYTDPEAA
ncbi:MAG: hypothetical protein MJE66_07810, partial [Proteobacteria bacterium]|nr:hypothetical protein [Pseudomonadota bacterium]